MEIGKLNVFYISTDLKITVPFLIKKVLTPSI